MTDHPQHHTVGANGRSRRRVAGRVSYDESSDDSEADIRTSKPTSPRSRNATTTPSTSGNKRDMERARKLELRKARNRLSAAASRKRKDDRIEELQAQVNALLGENAKLKLEMQRRQAAEANSGENVDPFGLAPCSAQAPFFSHSGNQRPHHVANSCPNTLPAVSALLNLR